MKDRSIFFREILVLFLLSFVPIIWLSNSFVIIGHDSGFRLTGVKQLIDLFYTWQPKINFGTDWTLYRGFLLIQMPETVLTTLTGSLQNAEKILFVFWFFIIMTSMYMLLYSLNSKRSFTLFRLSGSIFYAYNFYLQQAWFIAERAKFSLYAALPIALLLYYKTVSKEYSLLKGSFIFGLLYLLLNGGGSPPLYGATVIGFFVITIVLGFSELKNGNKSGVVHILKTIALFLLTFFLFNAYWIFPQIGLLRSNYQSAVSERGGIDGLIAWERLVSKNASIWNLIRLQGNLNWFDAPVPTYAKPYVENTLLIAISCIPFFLFVIFLFLYRRLQKNRAEKIFFLVFILFFCVGLPLAGGTHEPFGRVYFLFMRYIPGFAIFRSSFYKFAPILWMSLIVTSMYMAAVLVRKVKNNIIRIGISLSILCGLLLYAQPLFNPDLFSFMPGYSTRLTIPPYVYTVSDYLNSHVSDTGRVFLLPKLDTGFIGRPIDTNDWGYYSLDVLPRISTNVSVLANDSTDDEDGVKQLYEAFELKDPSIIKGYFQMFGVTHILFRNDTTYRYPEKEKLDKNTLISFLQEQFGKPVFSDGQWTVYATQVHPWSLSRDTSVALRTGSATNGSLLSQLTGKTIIASSDSQNTTTDLTVTVDSVAECLYCHESEYDQYRSSITIPTLPLSPKNPFYRFIRKRIPDISSYSTAQKIDMYLSFSLRRLAEIQRGGDIYGTEDLVEYFSAITSLFAQLPLRDKVYYSSRISAYNDVYSHALLKNPSTFEQSLSALSVSIKPYFHVTDGTSYVFGVEIPNTGLYKILTYPQISDILIDDKLVDISKIKTIDNGYHIISIPKKDTNLIPYIAFESNLAGTSEKISQSQPIFTEINPTKYVTTLDSNDVTSLLVLNQKFDPRWKLSLHNSKLSPIRVNGYATGWIINKGISGEGTIEFEPQKIFLYGLLVSITSFFGWTGIIFLNLYNQKKKIKN